MWRTVDNYLRFPTKKKPCKGSYWDYALNRWVIVDDDDDMSWWLEGIGTGIMRPSGRKVGEDKTAISGKMWKDLTGM